MKEIYNITHNTIKDSGWQLVSLCIAVPSGNYMLEFEGILGEAYQTILAVDSVQLIQEFDACGTIDDLIVITNGK